MIEQSQIIEDVQPFNIHAQEYNQSKYWGRFMTLFSVQNPANFYLSHSTIESAKELIEGELEKAKDLKPGETFMYSTQTISQIKKAKNIYASAVHPDTKEYVPRFMRLCSYSSVSIPVLFGMILSKPTTFNIVFWQCMNQTYSAGMNYANRNALSSLDTKGILMAYSAAVSTSIGIGLGFRKLLAPISKNLKGPSQLFVNFFISLAAVGSAGFLNLLIMRSNEIKEGIMLTDSEGNQCGKSKVIGKRAVVNTAFSRFLMPVPPLLIPTLAFYMMEKKKIVPKNKIAKMSVESLIFFV
jgi:F0F1-type ATP synthase membrane subunit c/vacuolar-type H+-ATPase subunit K